MATSKPQIRSLFATPVTIHFLPIAAEVNAELKPLILEKTQSNGTSARGQGWCSAPDFASWGGNHAETLFRVVRDLANGLTSTRTGGRLTLEWEIAASAAMRQKGEYQELAARPGAFWSGIYYVDDGYAKSDDESWAANANSPIRVGRCPRWSRRIWRFACRAVWRPDRAKSSGRRAV